LGAQAIEDGLVNDLTVPQVLDHDPFEERRCHPAIPNALWIDHYDRTTGAHAEAWSLATLNALGAEQESLPLQKLCQERVQFPAATLG
jgi:hypothetical protein